MASTLAASSRARSRRLRALFMAGARKIARNRCREERPMLSAKTVKLSLRPLGFVKSPFVDRVSTPRQPSAARGVQGTIELLPGENYEHALEDLDAWDHIW